MKKIMTALLIAGTLIAIVSCASTNGGKKMTITSSGISGGVIAAKYGQFGDASNISEKNPATDNAGTKVIMKVNSLSFPISIKNVPEGTKAFALYLHDPDAAVHGFGDFTHWIATFTVAELKEGASKNPPALMVQGVNGWGDTGYAGMGPPDKLGYTLVTGGPVFHGTHDYHTYVLEIMALDAIPALSEGFTQEQLNDAIKGTILAQSTYEAKYHTNEADFK